MADTVKENWRDMSDDELKKAIRSIIEKSSSEKEINQKAKDELGYGCRIAVSWDGTGRMFQAMFYNKEGKILSL